MRDERHAITRRRHMQQSVEARRAHIGHALIAKLRMAAKIERLIAQAMSVMQKQQGLRIDVAGRDRLLRGEPMIGGYDDPEWLLGKENFWGGPGPRGPRGDSPGQAGPRPRI